MDLGKLGVLGLMVALTACSTEKVNQCSSDSDCNDVAYPFCDVNGEFAPSGGEHNICTAVPSDCPLERCGCTPGATTCAGDMLTSCNADGRSTSETVCATGCAVDGSRCTSFEASNGLDIAVTAGEMAGAVTIPDGATIDTTKGLVTNSSNAVLPVSSMQVMQYIDTGITPMAEFPIRAFYAASFDVGSVHVTGREPFALVAPGTIVIHGVWDASSVADYGGPGSLTGGNGEPNNPNCVGHFVVAGGGGGNATNGGDGAYYDTRLAKFVATPGGLAQSAYSPLVGGCGGSNGGGGGGGIQIVSRTAVTLTNATINLGGGGAPQTGMGGGAGGTLIIEAPMVSASGTVAANGGGGGGCDLAGEDATTNATPAGGGGARLLCNGKHGGDGGTLALGPGSGSTDTTGTPSGGGGAVGRMIIRTRDASYDSTSLVKEIVSEVGMLVVR